MIPRYAHVPWFAAHLVCFLASLAGHASWATVYAGVGLLIWAVLVLLGKVR